MNFGFRLPFSVIDNSTTLLPWQIEDLLRNKHGTKERLDFFATLMEAGVLVGHFMYIFF